MKKGYWLKDFLFHDEKGIEFEVLGVCVKGIEGVVLPDSFCGKYSQIVSFYIRQKKLSPRLSSKTAIYNDREKNKSNEFYDEKNVKYDWTSNFNGKFDAGFAVYEELKDYLTTYCVSPYKELFEIPSGAKHMDHRVPGVGLCVWCVEPEYYELKKEEA